MKTGYITTKELGEFPKEPAVLTSGPSFIWKNEGPPVPVAVLEMREVEEIDIFLDSLTRLDNKASLPQLRNYIISIKNDAIRVKAILEGKEER